MSDRPHPLAREGLVRRGGPFLAVMVLTLASAWLVDGATRDGRSLAAAAVVNLLIVALVVVAPWESLPRSISVVPPLAYLGVVALLAGDSGTGQSLYYLLALLPVFWLAMYGTLGQLALGATAAVFVALLPELAGNSEFSDVKTWRSALAVAIGSGVVLLVEAARSRDEHLRTEARLNAVVENMSDGLVLADEEGKLNLANPAAREMLGVRNGSPGALRWPRDAQVYEADGITPVPVERLPVERASRGEAVHEQELLIRNPDKPAGVWVSMSATPLTTDDEPDGAVAVVHDVSERKRAERCRAAQANVSRALAEAVTAGEALYGALRAVGEGMGWEVGLLWRLEQGGEEPHALGAELDTLRFKLMWRAPGFDAGKLEDDSVGSELHSPIGMLGQAWTSGRPQWRLDISGDGLPRSEHALACGLGSVLCAPVVASGSVVGVMEFYASELEAPSEELVATMAAIGSQVGEFVERKEAEQEAERTKDEFFGLVSHELRTPLTSILGYLDLLLGDDGLGLDEQTLRFLTIARRNSDRLLRLVSDLLLVTQLQAGQFKIKQEPVDLNAIAASAVELAQPMAKERGVALSLINDQVPELVGDSDRLAQLLDNLVSNALKFTPQHKGQLVKIEVTRSGDEAQVSVSNTGSYIPPDERARVFERFFRSSSATVEVIQGAGLGLTIVKAIVEAHGGRVAVDSVEEVGTTFRFWLPLNRPGSGSSSERSQ